MLKTGSLVNSLTVGLLLNGSVWAQSNAEKSALEELAKTALARTNMVDSPVPNSPALAALDVTTESTIRARAPDQFATTLLNNVDKNGNFQSGLAIDFVPAELYSPSTVTLEKYRAVGFDGWSTRLYANTQLSIATSEGQSKEDEATRLALGLQVTPWISIESDPRRDLGHLNCLSDLSKLVLSAPDLQKKIRDQQVAEDVTPLSKRGREIRSEENIKAYTEAIPKAKGTLNEGKNVTDCRTTWNDAHPSTSAWSLGIAPTWISTDSDLDDLEWTGMSLWSSLSIDLGDTAKLPLIGKNGELIFHVRYRTDEVVADSTNIGNFFEQDTLLATTKFRFESSKDSKEDMFQNVRYSVEGAYVSTERNTGVDDDYYIWSGKAEFRAPQIGENLWLNFTAGRSSGRSDSEETFGGLNVNWAFNNKSNK